jgi:hypothetical protein
VKTDPRREYKKRAKQIENARKQGWITSEERYLMLKQIRERLGLSDDAAAD